MTIRDMAFNILLALIKNEGPGEADAKSLAEDAVAAAKTIDTMDSVTEGGKEAIAEYRRVP